MGVGFEGASGWLVVWLAWVWGSVTLFSVFLTRLTLGHHLRLDSLLHGSGGYFSVGLAAVYLLSSLIYY